MSQGSALINALSDRLGDFPGVQLNFTQPIQNLFDELLSGVRTQLAIKVYGENIDTLRTYAELTGQAVEGIPGLVDLGIEQSWGQPQYRIVPNREAVKRYGITVDQIMEAIELAVGGEVISQIYKETRRFGIHVRFQEQFRGKKIEDLVVVKQKTTENIQSITGATITSEAVTHTVKEKAEQILKEIAPK